MTVGKMLCSIFIDNQCIKALIPAVYLNTLQGVLPVSDNYPAGKVRLYSLSRSQEDTKKAPVIA